MAEYLITARNQAGAKSTQRIEADSANLAVETLEAQGWTEIVLHNDDIGARYSNQADVAKHISPKDYVSLRNAGGGLRGMLFLAKMLYAKSWFSFLIALAALIFRRSRSHPWDYWDTTIIVYLISPILIALFSRMSGKGRRYRQLIDASSWGRWEETLQFVEKLRGVSAADDLVFHEAKSLAALGRIDEARAALKPFSDGETMPKWLYLARLPEVYFYSGQRQEIVPVLEQAREIAPQNPVVLIDLASAVLRYRHDARRARALLDEAKTHAISDIALPAAMSVEGRIALADRNPREARDLLEQAYSKQAALRSSSPVIDKVLDYNHAYLALAYAAMGEPIIAAKHFQKAEPRLRALNSDDILAQCEQALGGFAR